MIVFYIDSKHHAMPLFSAVSFSALSLYFQSYLHNALISIIVAYIKRQHCINYCSIFNLIFVLARTNLSFVYTASLRSDLYVKMKKHERVLSEDNSSYMKDLYSKILHCMT